MGIMDTVTGMRSPDRKAGRDTAGEESAGAYWCDGCSVRVRDVAVDEEGLARDDEGTPLCPECGDAMRFERSHGEGCAC
ncbi:hypothetical protein BV210_17515 [Halorientalis sp. IM1011]|uniref:hypothetical protein n=1 Tax=Halorientalis sp. IM1011 TaxID=1932360 RepID=UPI00097CC81B|nr:hypothetical protein [Halorientalis sp. IM1011]AQL41197.1 hypothetical protein BV210_00025 [Halorientalis sp. IM1011]AQL44404.1 hypothetical protein BV210_17515 [Halorientalis sp. IM1011]